MSDVAPVSVPVEDLLAQADWVRIVARRLVRDQALADDIAQEALVVGLRTAPRESGSLRAWLHTVLRNLARDHHRRERARTAREEATARTVFDDDSAKLVERADAQRFLVERVLRVREPYRTTLLLRFFQRLSPREIARRHEVPLNTVRARINRGLRLLREDLKRREGERWPLALAPLLARSGGLVPVGRLPAGPHAAGRGVRIAGAALAGVAVVALVTLLSGGWPFGASTADSVPRGAAAADSGSRADATARAGRADAVGGSGGAPATPAGVVPLTGGGSPGEFTVGTPLRIDAPGAAGRSVDVHFRALLPPLRGAAPTEVVVPARLGEALAAELPRAAADGRVIPMWEVRVDDPDHVPLRAQVAPGGAETTLTLARAAIVTGSVPGAAAAHAAAAVRDGDALTPIDAVAAAPDGSFRLRLRPGVEHVVVVAAAGRRPRLLSATSAAETAVDLGLLPLEEGDRLTGRLVGDDGAPLADAAVALVAPDLGASLAVGSGTVTVGADRAEHARLLARTDADGGFSFEGLPRVAHEIHAGLDGATAGLARALTWKATPGDPADTRVVRTAWLRVVLLRKGQPAAGAKATTSADGRLQPHVVGADGVLALRTLPDEDVALSVRDDGTVAKRLFRAPAAGATRHETFSLDDTAELATWRVRWSGGTAPARCGIALRPLEGTAGASFVQDADGTDVVVEAPPGRWQATLRPGGDWRDATPLLAETTLAIELRAGETTTSEVPLREGARLLLAAHAPGGALVAARCTLTDAEGRRIPLVCPRQVQGFWSDAVDVLSPAGPTRAFPVLLPGVYRLTLEADGCAPRTVELTLGPGELRRVDETLEPR